MSGINNAKINAAYVASWKEKNPKLSVLEIEGHYLKCYQEKIDLREIYMQDILINPYLYQEIATIEPQKLLTIIKLHVYAMEVKEKTLFNKVRRMKEYGY